MEVDTEEAFVKDSEKLRLMFMLCDICQRQDRVSLSRFVYVVSRNIETEEFDDLMRKAMKIMSKSTVDDVSCQDWLINQLFSIYKGQ